MNAVVTPAKNQDFAVADLSLADWGRKEMVIAETEMPGLMAIRKEFEAGQPLEGARIAGSLHMTIQTAMLIDTLKALGADVRWASCNIYSTQDHAAAAIAAGGTPVFAYKGESLDDYWEFTHRIFEWPNGQFANMILDDGGDATLLLMLGARAEKDASVIAKPTNEEETALYASIRKRLETQPGWYSKRLAADQGRHRGDDHRREAPVRDREEGRAAVPGHQRQRLGDQVEVRQPLRLPRVAGGRDQARDRRDDRRQGRAWSAATATSARARRNRCARCRRRSGSPRSTRSARCRPRWKGYRVVTMDEACDKADIFVTATGNVNVITHEHMKPHEAPGDRLQHRPLRQRDRDRRRCASTRGRTSSRRSTT